MKLYIQNEVFRIEPEREDPKLYYIERMLNIVGIKMIHVRNEGDNNIVRFTYNGINNDAIDRTIYRVDGVNLMDIIHDVGSAIYHLLCKQNKKLRDTLFTSHTVRGHTVETSEFLNTAIVQFSWGGLVTTSYWGNDSIVLGGVVNCARHANRNIYYIL